jgi:iron complex transport system permease protein
MRMQLQIRRRHRYGRGLGLLAGFIAMLMGMVASATLGAVQVPFDQAIAAFTDYDADNMGHVIVRTTRAPRALYAAAIGASLAAAGAVMQAMTRNPLASPSIMGINAGAASFVVAAITIFSVTSLPMLLTASFAGAAISGTLVFLLSAAGREKLSSMKIVMAGSAVTALFASLTQGMLVHDEAGLNDVLYWLTGSIAGRPLDSLLRVLPFMAAGWLVAFLLARHLNVMEFGDQAAQGLGQQTAIVKLLSGLLVIVLAGAAVAIAGPIGFIGIIVPHIVRSLAGRDYRWLIPYNLVFGALLLLLADLAARFIIMPEELPVGVMTAAIGVPYFVYIARRGWGQA